MRALTVLLALFAGLPERGSDPPGYLLTRSNGMAFPLRSFERKGDFYWVVELSGSQTKHYADSVQSIEPLTEKQAETARNAAPARPTPSPSMDSARTTARTTVRTTARTKPRRKYYAPQQDLPSFDEIFGGAPSGFGTFVGPRGGVYHYSANGNKVYQ